jgi:hypothetical protein
MNASSVDIAEILQEESALGLTLATNLYIGKEPNPEPANCVIIFDTYGQTPQLNLTDQGYEYPSIQIRVRNVSYVTGWNMIESIKLLLHGMGQVTYNGAYYSMISCAYGPGLLDWDENSRARFICNFNLQRRNS